jgi:hypothetical protein
MVGRTCAARLAGQCFNHLNDSKRPGKRSGKDIGEPVQIVLRGNQLLEPADEPVSAAITA